MTKAKKITLSVFVILLILLAVAALVLFVWWYIQGRSAMDDAAAQVKRNENMVFIDGWPQHFVKKELYDDMFGENADRMLSTLPQMTISEEEAFQTAMDFFERYDLSGGYPVKQTQVPLYVPEQNGKRYYLVIIEIDKPRPEHIINKYAIRKNVYRFFVNDSGVLYVSFQ